MNFSSCIFARFFFIFAEPTRSAWLGFYDLFPHLQVASRRAVLLLKWLWCFKAMGMCSLLESKLAGMICWCLLILAWLFLRLTLFCFPQAFFSYDVALLFDGWVDMPSLYIKCTPSRHVLSLLLGVFEAGCFCPRLHWEDCQFHLWCLTTWLGS
jgi:hypothetical protein